MKDTVEQKSRERGVRNPVLPWKRRVKKTLLYFSVLGTVLAVACYWLVFVRVSNGSLTLDQPLRIPAELRGTQKEGRLEFKLVVKEAAEEFRPGTMTSTAGVNGPYLGPTVRVQRGDSVDFVVVNRLDQETTMHWHGMHVPAQMDGTPHQVIEPAKSWTAAIEVDQQAATLWYHPHPHGMTGRQSYSGVAGLLIVDDDNSATLDLPQTYGVDDFPLVIQDKIFDSEGQFDFSIARGAVYGDEILVNGTWNPTLDVPARLVRFRLLNGSNARVYHIGFEDGRRFDQIATDGGFLEQPLRTDRVVLAPGERAEVLVDFSDAQPAVLKSFPGGDVLQTLEFFFDGAGNGHFKLLRLQPQADGLPSHTIPDRLNTIERFSEGDAAVTRVMNLGGFGQPGGRLQTRSQAARAGEMGNGRELAGPRGADRATPRNASGSTRSDSTFQGAGIPINGKLMDMHRIDEVVRRGDMEIWEITNRSGQPHPFHVHLVQFQILERDGLKASGADLGWKDTVLVDAGERVRTIMKFEKYADPATPYMYHCHIMEHEDRGMMGQFLVVDEPEGLDQTKDKYTVVLFILGFSCRHCYEQVQLFDERLRGTSVKLVVVTPETGVDREQVAGFQAMIVSDPQREWAGWLGLMHEGPVHGTYLLNRQGKRIWGDDSDQPYMDIDALFKRIDTP